MATMASIDVAQNGGIIFARTEWLHSGKLLLSGRLKRKEVETVLKTLIATASKKHGCPECQSEIGSDLKSRWADVMHLMTSGFLTPRQVAETLRDLNALQRHLPLPERVRIQRLNNAQHGGEGNAGVPGCTREEVG
jgi:hypothetical protein